MKILHVPYCFYPDAVGGTEVYVESLAHELQRLGDQVVIAAPAAREAAYVHANITVRRFAIDPDLRSLEALYGEGDPVAASAFEKLLDAERPDLVHLHTLTSATSTRVAAVIRRRGIPLVFTYHTPTVSCPRGSLLRWGKTPCDGELTPEHCTGCMLQHLGLPRAAAELIGRFPESLGDQVSKRNLSGRLWTALRMRTLIRHRETAFHEFMRQTNRVVAVSAWVREVLLRNGVAAEKIVLCRHGLPGTPVEMPFESSAVRAATKPLRLVFVGRLEPLKGLDLILRVLRKRRELSVTLDAYGIAAPGNEDYVQKLLNAAADDSRVRLLPALPHHELVKSLAAYDLLLVPSQGLETGPLVVLEAFAAGVPVLGSRLGGIQEWVEEGRMGRLVEASSASAWGNALEELSRERSTLDEWRRHLPTPRSMADVAREMRNIYSALLEGVHV